MPAKLGELADFLNCKLDGDPDQIVDSVSTLEKAEKNSLCFFLDSNKVNILSKTKAGCVILTENMKDKCPSSCILSNDPYLAYAKAARYLYPLPKSNGIKHITAVISERSNISSTAEISENVVIKDNVFIGDNVIIAPNTVIGPNSIIKSDTVISENVTIKSNVQIGNGCFLHPGCVIGSDGFGFANDNDEWKSIPQLGGVKIDSDVVIGANSTIDCGTIDDTFIGKGVKIDNLVHIGHNVRIGEFTAIAGCSAVAGSTIIGKRCRLGGGASIIGHLNITDDVYINAKTTVVKSISTSGTYSGVIPAQEANIWKRNIIRLKDLDKLFKKIRGRERR